MDVSCRTDYSDDLRRDLGDSMKVPLRVTTIEDIDMLVCVEDIDHIQDRGDSRRIWWKEEGYMEVQDTIFQLERYIGKALKHE